MQKGDSRPIGVFDSGVGGLTVLVHLIEKFPNENFIYVGDTARLPYGSKSPHVIRRYSEQILDYLIKQNIKIAVIACNTASSQMQQEKYKNIPVYDVIRPGAEAAVNLSPRKRIGMIGTRATVASQSYVHAIQDLDSTAQVFSTPCPLLVHLAEEGWDMDPVTNLIVYRYLQPLMQHQIDSLVLGCTHYPLLSGSIQRVCGSSVQLIESGPSLYEKLKHDLEIKKWQANTETISSPDRLDLRMTDDSGTFTTLAKKILGPHQFKLQLIHLSEGKE